MLEKHEIEIDVENRNKSINLRIERSRHIHFEVEKAWKCKIKRIKELNETFNNTLNRKQNPTIKYVKKRNIISYLKKEVFQNSMTIADIDFYIYPLDFISSGS